VHYHRNNRISPVPEGPVPLQPVRMKFCGRAVTGERPPGRSDSFLWYTDNSVEREGRKARPTPMDLRSIPVEVHAFESHPSHFFTVFRIRFSFELIHQILTSIEYPFSSVYLSKNTLPASLNYTV